MVSVMPCTAKKAEILRPDSATNGVRDVDFSMTTSELLDMMAQAGLTMENCPLAEADAPFSYGSGGGTIFGATGGVAEAVLRYLSPKLGHADIRWIESSGVRGPEGIKRAQVLLGEREIRMAVVSGLKNAEELLRRIESGDEQAELIEVMACPGGCVMGGGQPADEYTVCRDLAQRSGGLYATDEDSPIRCAQDNRPLEDLRNKLICADGHALLHRNAEHSA